MVLVGRFVLEDFSTVTWNWLFRFVTVHVPYVNFHVFLTADKFHTANRTNEPTHLKSSLFREVLGHVLAYSIVAINAVATNVAIINFGLLMDIPNVLFQIYYEVAASIALTFSLFRLGDDFPLSWCRIEELLKLIIAG